MESRGSSTGGFLRRLRPLWAMLPTMIKGASGPVIAIALFQYAPFAERFPTFGYLIAIVAILGMPIMPRIKFLQTLILDLVAVCVATAVSLLACYCCVQARNATSSPPSAGPSGENDYNSSASVVSSIWLFFSILVANALRFYRSQLHLPMILYAIYANIVGTYAPVFATMDESMGFIKSLFESFLAGLGIATVVHFAWPRNSRQVTTMQCKRFANLTQAILEKQQRFFASVQRVVEGDSTSKAAAKDMSDDEKTAATSLRATLTPMTNLLSQMRTDLPFTKREIAFGRLEAGDFENIFNSFQKMMQPLLGIDFVAELFIGEEKSVAPNQIAGYEEKRSTQEKNNISSPDDRDVWRFAINAMHAPAKEMLQTISDCLSHVMYIYGMMDKPTDADSPSSPGGGYLQFSEHLQGKLERFRQEQEKIVAALHKGRASMERDHISTPHSQSEHSHHGSNEVPAPSKDLQSLHAIAYANFLLSSMGESALEFAQVADTRRDTLRKRRIAWPGTSRSWKWLKSIFKADSQPSGIMIGQDDVIYTTSDTSKDVRTTGLKLQTMLLIFSRPEVLYGFRVACATLSIGVIDYIYQTQQFFIQERLVWSLIMIAISMTMTTGSGVFGFIYRILGSILATCTSLAIWYIAGARGIPAAVLPLLWVVCLGEVYMMMRYPQLSIAVIITLITQVLILGYELGVDKIGIPAISVDGSRYYPIYELAPYRLATVVGGLGVAFVWTYFPYPVTAQTALRKQLGETHRVLANYYAIVHAVIHIRLSHVITSNLDHGKQFATQLEKSVKSVKRLRNDILVLVSSLRQHSAVTSYEIRLGGRFPKQTYIQTITRLIRLMSYVSLLDLATAKCTKVMANPPQLWPEEVRLAVRRLSNSTDEVTGYLVMISTSLLSASPLPPNQKPKKPSEFTKQTRHICETVAALSTPIPPALASFAAVTVISEFFDDEFGKLLDETKAILGQVQFAPVEAVEA